MTFTDTELDAIDAKLSSQIGDDVSVIFNHEYLFKQSRAAITYLRAQRREDAMQYLSDEGQIADQIDAAVKAERERCAVVKKLEWEIVPTGYGPETYEAYAETGFYQVFTDEDSCCGAVVAEFATNREQFGTLAARGVARANGFVEAKAAAQSDYDARIMNSLNFSAWNTRAAPVVTDAMVDAALKSWQGPEFEPDDELSRDDMRAALEAALGVKG